MNRYYYISGNTYPFRNELKSIGCKWDGMVKQWCAPDEFIALKARNLIADNEHKNQRNKVSKYAVKLHKSFRRKGLMG